MWRNDTKCKYMRMCPLKTLGRKGLTKYVTSRGADSSVPYHIYHHANKETPLTGNHTYHVRTTSAHTRKYYICNVLSHWLGDFLTWSNIIAIKWIIFWYPFASLKSNVPHRQSWGICVAFYTLTAVSPVCWPYRHCSLALSHQYLQPWNLGNSDYKLNYIMSTAVCSIYGRVWLLQIDDEQQFNKINISLCNLIYHS